MDLDFLKELHFKELERREHLDEIPGRLTTMLTLVAAVYTYYLKNFSPDNSWMTWALAASLAGTAVLFVLAIIWIFRASVGYGYAFLAYPTEFESYSKQLRQYYEASAIEGLDLKKTISADVLEFLRARLIEAATTNSKHNNQRSELFYNVKRFLVGLAVTTFVSGIPILFQLWQTP